jgi:AcrR family transcriptional regulator
MERRQEILHAAQAVFNAKGYAEATVGEIAAKASISKGSIYNYFGGKDDLFAAVFAEALGPDHTEVDDLASLNVPASEKLQRFLDYVFEQLETFTRSGRLVMELWSVATKRSELNEAMAGVHAHWRAHIRAILEEGVWSGEFGTHFDPRIAGSLIWATINGIMVQAMFDRETKAGEHSLASLKRGLLAALSAWSRTSP